MGVFQKIFDNNKVKVLAGDIQPGDWEYNLGTLWGAFDQVQLTGEIKKVTLQTEESVKKLPEMVGWGLAGSVLLGPTGLLAGLILGGNKKEVCALVELRDGRKFIGTMDTKVYQQLLAMELAKK